MGNNPVIGVDPDGRFSRFGAWWRSKFISNSYTYNTDTEWAVGWDTWENDGQGAYLLGHSITEGGPGLGKDFINLNKVNYSLRFTRDFAGGVKDFGEVYNEMKEANWQLSDKYFHSKANFKAALRGPGGEYAAEKMSNLREIFDQRIKGDELEWSLEDQKANRYGRERAKHYNVHQLPSIDYKKAIPSYRPASLPDKY